LPISTVPAAASRSAQVASLSGILSCSSFDWQVVSDALGIDDVLEADRDAVHRTTRAARHDRRLGRARLGQRALFGQVDKGVQRLSSACTRSRQAWVSSTGESCFAAICFAA
jgi:hypothetical protein